MLVEGEFGGVVWAFDGEAAFVGGAHCGDYGAAEGAALRGCLSVSFFIQMMFPVFFLKLRMVDGGMYGMYGTYQSTDY